PSFIRLATGVSAVPAQAFASGLAGGTVKSEERKVNSEEPAAGVGGRDERLLVQAAGFRSHG
ncbi:MAG: hypothetical protein KBA18_11745, partial [Kiritimatiellae bacterium]|nr:hypothetical protein [Kiritimatiellia bacterium]